MGTSVNEWNRKLVETIKAGFLSYAVIQIIASGPSPIHGYRIARIIRQLTNDGLSINPSSVYLIIHRLKEEGFVEVITESSAEGPMRKCYSLTVDGLNVYDRLTRSYERISDNASDILNNCHRPPLG